ncbi:MAG: hydantoinase/oxoprolinase N-terminal domain-containing protein, partial [Rhodospirillales bacterium]
MQDKVFRIGCDIGGTFTDFVAVNRETGETCVEKVLTTPARPADAILTGFDKIAETQDDFMGRSELIVHGTTLVINALIERKGNKTALITTRGFQDVLEMRNELRYDVYDLQIELPKPLVPRALRFEITQ